MVNRLELAPGTLSRPGSPPLHFWEPVIDGRPLRQILVDAAEGEHADEVMGDTVPVLVHSWPVGLPADALVLLGEQPPELASGRIPMFVCPACGDLGCGAMTANIEWTADTVIWSDFGWEVSDETDEEQARLPAGPLVFDRAQYDAELRRFVDTFGEVRASLAAHLLTDGSDAASAPAARRSRRRWILAVGSVALVAAATAALVTSWPRPDGEIVWQTADRTSSASAAIPDVGANEPLTFGSIVLCVKGADAGEITAVRTSEGSTVEVQDFTVRPQGDGLLGAERVTIEQAGLDGDRTVDRGCDEELQSELVVQVARTGAATGSSSDLVAEYRVGDAVGSVTIRFAITLCASGKACE